MSDPMRNAGVAAGLLPHAASKIRHVARWMLTACGGWLVTLGISGALTVVLMSATHFALHSDFRWLLLLPALVWLAGLVAYLANRGASSVGHDRGHGGVN